MSTPAENWSRLAVRSVWGEQPISAPHHARQRHRLQAPPTEEPIETDGARIAEAGLAAAELLKRVVTCRNRSGRPAFGTRVEGYSMLAAWQVISEKLETLKLVKDWDRHDATAPEMVTESGACEPLHL